MRTLIIATVALIIATVATARADEVRTITFQPMAVPRLAELKKQAKKPVVRKPTRAEETEADLQQQDLVRQTLDDRKVVEDAVARMKAIANAARQERRHPAVAAEKANKEIAAIMADLQKRKLDRGITPPTCKVER